MKRIYGLVVNGAFLVAGAAVLIGFGVTTNTGVPSNLIVWTCAQDGLVYVPGCTSRDDCAHPSRVLSEKKVEWEQRLEGMTIRDAYKRGYKAAPKCQAILHDPREVTLIRFFLDYVGIWRLDPWNQDGTWRR